MCGIAGLIGWTGTENQISDIIKKFQSSLHHRGPDNKGYWVSRKEMISLVHTRLSILDLSKSGNQPMHSSCGRYTITFNGEIYNHLEIRSRLQKIGFNKWCGTSDTERFQFRAHDSRLVEKQRKRCDEMQRLECFVERLLIIFLQFASVPLF
mgnify:CR=1 FL=1